jgi:trimethylamine---corrinoid protein Co-methyltransferase
MITKLLNDDQIKKIHTKSLEILKEVGVVIPHHKMLELFADSGADVNFEGKRVKIRTDIVMSLLNQATNKFTIYGSDIKQKAEFGYGKRNYNSSAGQALWINNVGGERRYARLEDVIAAAKTAEILENINIVGAMSDPQEIDLRWRCVEVCANMIKNTGKPITFWFHDRASAKYLIDIVVELRGSIQEAIKYPLFYPFFEPISPLRFPYNGIDILFETARINLPVPIGPMAQMGISAPGTIAATIVQQNAEILAGICITQLIKPGTAVCYGGTCHAFDMATTQLIFGGPEQSVLGVAMTQMGRYYKLPVYINVGLADSKCIDAQAGVEVGVTLANGVASGADIFGHFGICGVDQAGSLDFLIFQNEIASYVNSIMRDIVIDDYTLGLNEINEIGPGGTYLSSKFTAENFRNETWFPKLFDRNYYQKWFDDGKITFADRCNKQKNKILSLEAGCKISEKKVKVIDEIVEESHRCLSI